MGAAPRHYLAFGEDTMFKLGGGENKINKRLVSPTV